VLHELGHRGFGLADEYSHAPVCERATNESRQPASEPASANATVMTSPVKWARYVVASPTPMTRNANCNVCDTQSNPFSESTVGLFEGANAFHRGAYRSQYDCRMRTLGRPYCVACQDRIISTLVERLPSGMVACRSTGLVIEVAGASMLDNAAIQLAPPR